MSAPAWTPGPSEAEAITSDSAPNERPWVGRLAEDRYAALSCGETQEEAIANARLIASAPELYEALAKATGMLRDYIMAVGVLADDGWVLAECDAALAKARGQ